MGDNDDDSSRAPVAIGSAPLPELVRAPQHSTECEPDIEAERGYARDHRVIITETLDEPHGGSRVRHAGDDPKIHEILLNERSRLERHRVSEEQRTKRQLAWAACILLLGSAAIFAFAPQSVNAYIGAALLLIAGGAFGVKSFRIKVKDFELEAGDTSERSSTTREVK
jgi:hypothetical protein